MENASILDKLGDTMEELNLREIQMAEFAILKKFDEICRKNSFRYYLCFGTLIGAVRHKGFIPWDDDIDVVMPRLDYDKFVEFCKNNREELGPYMCENYTLEKNFIYPITRVCDNRYLVHYENREEHNFGLFIDVYPFDGCGNTKEESIQIWKSMQNDTSVISSASRKYFEKSPNGALRNIIKRALYAYTKKFGAVFFMKRLENRAKSHPYETSKYVACTNWIFDPKYICEREWFEQSVEMDFEGNRFLAPSEYDKLLRSMYGDYMELPPVEEQEGHHCYKAFKKG